MGKIGIPTKGVALVKAYPRVIELLENCRSSNLDENIRWQLRLVHVPSQILSGTPSHFQFMAYPLPLLSFEERQKHQIFPETTVDVQGDDWKVAIDINLFGRINWFYVDGIPELYDALKPYLPMD